VVAAVRHAPAVHRLDRSRWRLADLRTVVSLLEDYSLGGLSQLLTRLQVRRRRGRLWVHSPDPDYLRKTWWLARAVQAARDDPTHVRVFYGDECGLYRQPTLAPVYARAGEEPRAALSHRANTCHRVAGALDAVIGQVVWTSGSKVGVTALKRFLRALRAAAPDAKTLLLIWDNWPVHQHPAVLAEAARLGIQLLWLPTYAPWLNPIEKLWRWLKQNHLHHHRLADDWATLKATIAGFLDQFAHGSTALLRYVGLLPD